MSEPAPVPVTKWEPPVEPPRLVVAPPPAPAAPDAPAAPVLSELVSSLGLLPEVPTRPFQVGQEAVAIYVHGELLTRLSKLIAIQGEVALKPERKRFRGRATDKPFGDGEAQMVRASGTVDHKTFRSGM